MTPLTSVVIPCYNGAAHVGEAIDSALAQSVPVEVIVVDDGSTDETARVLDGYGDRIRRFSLPHSGPSKARNVGLEAATGEFVMWLDHDDVIAPNKIDVQLREFADVPWADWVLCDVLIQDAARSRHETASDRYNYRARELSGWIDAMLAEAPFIPIMSPLVRRSVLKGIWFAETVDGTPEDYVFWQKVAKVARVRYVPQVLATYRKSQTGRSRLPKSARAIVPNIEEPLRLNLGCGTKGTRSWHPIPGFVNLDKSMGWRFEDGLQEFTDASVAAISISHACMYIRAEKWPFVFSEFARVLKPGGVLRITEDDTEHPQSKRYQQLWNGSEPGVTYTGPAMVREHLRRAGLTPVDVQPDRSQYRDGSLIQRQHGEPPHVFHIEGIRQPGVVFAPHADDEALWASFTILRHRPQLVVCFKSARDYGPDEVRELETRDAAQILGALSVEHWDGGDLVPSMKALDRRVTPARVWAPDKQTSHPEHLAVAVAAEQVFGSRVTTYHTYDEAGKVCRGQRVEFEPEWTQAKLRALARYTSQITHPRANAWFMNDLHEYYGEVRA